MKSSRLFKKLVACLELLNIKPIQKKNTFLTPNGDVKKTRVVKTSFEIAARAAFGTGLVRHCKKIANKLRKIYMFRYFISFIKLKLIV